MNEAFVNPIKAYFLRHRSGVLMLAAVVITMAAIASFSRAHAATVCDLEILGGPGISNDALSGGTSNKLDLSQVGAIGTGGFGCDVVGKTGVFIGARARASWTHLSGSTGVGSTSLSSSYLYELEGRVGAHVTKQTSVYGFGGWALEDVSLTAVSNTPKPQGWELGAGVEHRFAGANGKLSPFFWRTDYTFVDFAGQDMKGLPSSHSRVQPNTSLVRLGFGIKFGEDNGPSPLDGAVQTLEAPCDPKLFNCHSSLK